MDAVIFLNELRRMCDSSGGCCNECPLHIDEICLTGTPSFSMDDVERIVDHVENWAKSHPVLRLTEHQRTAIRGRIAEGYLWVSRDKKNSFVCFSVKKPYKEFFNSEEYTLDSEYSVSISNDFYSFVTFENSPLYLPDLLFCKEE